MGQTWLQAAATVSEHLHGPLPDPVQTQGRHLLCHPDTPLHTQRAFCDDSFTGDLARRLEDLQFLQCLRAKQYGPDVAEEYPPSRTPPEFRTDYEARQRLLLLELEAPTPPDLEDEDEDDDDAAHWWTKSRARGPEFGPETKHTVTEEVSPASIAQLPTPPNSHPQNDTFAVRNDAVSEMDFVYTGADSDDEMDKGTYVGFRNQIAEPVAGDSAVQMTGLMAAGKKRAHSVNGLGEGVGRRVRCRPPGSPHFRGGARYLEAS